MTKSLVLAALIATALTLRPSAAEAFCGFYVGGAGADLFNNATQVALMREGTRTVLSMANNYQGPPSDFAMVVPVPVVLQKENVKTLTSATFRALDQLTAPRLVEYWEQDPCKASLYPPATLPPSFIPGLPMQVRAAPSSTLGVKIEAQFAEGEYQIVILSAENSVGLDTWLRQEKYNIPAGAEPVLKPYVAAGMKFFVAKVDITKVHKENGRTTLSPLRFHYDSDKFELPVRLGLLNSSGIQDLIVYVLAQGKRYEVANYPNVTVPTNLDLTEDMKGKFGSFYATLLDQTVAHTPRAAVTEYAWGASSCDPCPTPPLTPSDLNVLGANTLPPEGQQAAPGWGRATGVVITRIHLRYGKNMLGEDLIFREAEPIVGGREHVIDGRGTLESGSQRSSFNNFQARYAIRHPWKGAIECKSPQRGVWGGPPPNEVASGPQAATDAAFAPRGEVTLSSSVKQEIPELGIQPGGSDPPLPPELRVPRSGSCAGCAVGKTEGTMATSLALLGLALLAWRRASPQRRRADPGARQPARRRAGRAAQALAQEEPGCSLPKLGRLRVTNSVPARQLDASRKTHPNLTITIEH